MNTQSPAYGQQGPYGGQYPQGLGAPVSIPGQSVGQQPSYGYGSAPTESHQGQPSTYQPPYSPADALGQQYPGQQQAPGYGYNNQSTQYDQHYTQQPIQQLQYSQYSHQPCGAPVNDNQSTYLYLATIYLLTRKAATSTMATAATATTAPAISAAATAITAISAANPPTWLCFRFWSATIRLQHPTDAGLSRVR